MVREKTLEMGGGRGASAGVEHKSPVELLVREAIEEAEMEDGCGMAATADSHAARCTASSESASSCCRASSVPLVEREQKVYDIFSFNTTIFFRVNKRAP